MSAQPMVGTQVIILGLESRYCGTYVESGCRRGLIKTNNGNAPFQDILETGQGKKSFVYHCVHMLLPCGSVTVQDQGQLAIHALGGQ